VHHARSFGAINNDNLLLPQNPKRPPPQAALRALENLLCLRRALPPSATPLSAKTQTATAKATANASDESSVYEACQQWMPTQLERWRKEVEAQRLRKRATWGYNLRK
jgi:hypothetical protein